MKFRLSTRKTERTIFGSTFMSLPNEAKWKVNGVCVFHFYWFGAPIMYKSKKNHRIPGCKLWGYEKLINKNRAPFILPIGYWTVLKTISNNEFGRKKVNEKKRRDSRNSLAKCESNYSLLRIVTLRLKAEEKANEMEKLLHTRNSPSICRAVNRNWRRSSNELCASAAKNEKTETLADLVIFPIMDYCKHTSHRTQYRPTQCELITEKRAKCRSKRIWFRLYFPSSSLSFFEIPLRFSRQKWHWKKGGKK